APLFARSMLLVGESRPFDRVRALKRIRSLLGAFEKREAASFGGKLALFVLSAWVLWSALARGAVPWYSGYYGFSAAHFPRNAVHEIMQSPQFEPGMTIMSIPDWGGFITFASDGRLKPVLDDRNSLIGEALTRRYLEAF